jgi:CubicO group peptidase (beta-lactamase class C family)
MYSRLPRPMIHGYISPGFERVFDVFARNFREGREIGASVAIYYKGEKVVDLWAGHRDWRKRLPWEEDTMAIVYSTTKGITSLAFSLLHSRGLIDFDERVSTYWPTFAQRGKDDITIRQLLSHTAGLAMIEKPLTYGVLNDPDKLAKILAAQRPNWEPGTRTGYHAWTIGMYQAEIIRQVDPQRRTLQQFFDEELAKPLDLDLYIGQPEYIPDDRIADMIPFEPWAFFRNESFKYHRGMVRNILNLPSVASRSFTNPYFLAFIPNINMRRYRSLTIGSATGMGTARSLAAVYSEFATGGKKLGVSKKTLSELERNPHEAFDYDFILDVPMNYSLGFGKPCPHVQFGTNARAYGNFGAGGSFAFADPENEVGYAYVMNLMGTSIGDDVREKALREAFYLCI